MSLRRISCTVLLAAAVFTELLGGDEPRSLGDAEVAQLHQLIRPRPGESRWMEIDWYPTVWEARQKAAALGKPLFLWAGSGGAPPAGC